MWNVFCSSVGSCDVDDVESIMSNVESCSVVRKLWNRAILRLETKIDSGITSRMDKKDWIMQCCKGRPLVASHQAEAPLQTSCFAIASRCHAIPSISFGAKCGFNNNIFYCVRTIVGWKCIAKNIFSSPPLSRNIHQGFRRWLRDSKWASP